MKVLLYVLAFWGGLLTVAALLVFGWLLYQLSRLLWRD